MKRVYDVAGVTDKSVQVWLNGEKIPVKSFKDYVGFYRSEESSDAPLLHANVNPRWEVCFTVSDGQFQQVSHNARPRRNPGLTLGICRSHL